MIEWRLHGGDFGAGVIYERVLEDGTRLLAKVRNADGRPICFEITARFPNGARDFGRELAIAALERAISESDGPMFRDELSGELRSPLIFSDIPIGVPVIGSRGRRIEWTDRRLAELVRDLMTGDTEKWHLARNTIRQRANEAVRRSIAEVADNGPPKTWTLTTFGWQLLAEGADHPR